MRILSLALLISLSLVVAGCQAPEEPAEPAGSTTPDPAAALQEIDQLRSDWIAAAELDDAAAAAAFYTDDAVVASSDGPPAVGRQAIERLWTEGFQTASELEILSNKSETSGDIAYDYGEFSQRVTPAGGQPIQITGEYLVALERQADGAWKITRHVSVSRPADAAPAN